MSTANKRTINRAIRHFGIEVQNKRGDGYSYFTSLSTGDQIGDSEPVCYLSQLCVAEWVAWAKKAAESGILGGMSLGTDDPAYQAALAPKRVVLPRKTLKLSGNMRVISMTNGVCDDPEPEDET